MRGLVLALVLFWWAPARADDCYWQAREAMQRGDWIRARRICLRGVVEDSGRAGCYRVLCAIHVGLWDEERALEYAARARDLSGPENLGHVELSGEERVFIFRRAEEPPRPQSSKYLAEALRAMDQGDFERATLWLQSAILIAPRDPELWRTLEQAIRRSPLYGAEDRWLVEMIERRGHAGNL